MYKGVVAAGHELTAEAARIVLQEGGNAFDAALAAFFAACVAEPALASLGGGGFLLASSRGSDPVVFDFFVQTPCRKRPRDELNFHPTVVDFGTTQQEFHIGQGTAATPGAVKGVFQVHQDLGSIPLRRIAEPAVRYAREGVRLNATQAFVLGILNSIYMATHEAREVFRSTASAIRVAREGEMIFQTQLADTIERLAIEGDALFYLGEIAQRIAKHCHENGGQLTREDLEHYRVRKRKPLHVVYDRSRVMTNPPPSSGGILIAFGLEMLKASNFGAAEFGSYVHLRMLAEVMGLTNQVRTDGLDQSRQLNLLNNEVTASFLQRYRKEILHRAQVWRGTTHISVIDSSGNLASMSVSNGEGCGSMVPSTGFMLNNMLGEQDLNTNGFHRWKENERMSSMMAPTMIQLPDGQVIATGSGGSNRIRTALLQVIFNLVHFKMNVRDAVERARIHLESDKLSVEAGFPSATIRKLLDDFPVHEVWETVSLFFGGAHTVAAGQETCLGFGDPRRGGVSVTVL